MLDYLDWRVGYRKQHPNATEDDVYCGWIRYRTDEYLKHDEAEIDRKITQKVQEAKPEELVETFDKSALVHTSTCACKECRKTYQPVELVQVEPKEGKAQAGVRIIHGLNHYPDKPPVIQSREVVGDAPDPKTWLPGSVIEKLNEQKKEAEQKVSDAACVAALQSLKLTPKAERQKQDKQKQKQKQDVTYNASQLLDLNNPIIKNARRKASRTVQAV